MKYESRSDPLSKSCRRLYLLLVLLDGRKWFATTRNWETRKHLNRKPKAMKINWKQIQLKQIEIYFECGKDDGGALSRGFGGRSFGS